MPEPKRTESEDRALDRKFRRAVEDLADWVIEMMADQEPEMSLADYVEECTDAILRCIDATQQQQQRP